MKSILFQVYLNIRYVSMISQWNMREKNMQERNVFGVQNALIKWYFQRQIVYVHRC